MSSEYRKPQSILGQKQEELLESFINVKEYDKLLYYLESTLFNNAPLLKCPSPFVINCLLTLATLGEYYNADLIRREFAKVLSSQPIHIRAVNILRRLVDVVQYSMKEEGFTKTKYDIDDLTYAKQQLMKSLELIRTDKGRNLRPRLHNRRYHETTEPELDEFSSKLGENKQVINSTDWSPQKKLLEQQFQVMQSNSHESDEDSESEGEGVLDRKSFMILKNERFDIALQNGRLWAAVSWALQCSASKERIHLEVWRVWKPILEIVFDIAAIDLEDYLNSNSNTGSEDEKSAALRMTVCYKLFEKVGRYQFMAKLSEVIFITSNSTKNQKLKINVDPIFVNELTTAKSVHLAELLVNRGAEEEFTMESMAFRKKIFHLAYKLAKIAENLNSSHFFPPNFTTIDLVKKCNEQLMDAHYNDFRKFFILDELELVDESKLEALLDMFWEFFVQVNIFEFDTPSPDVINDADPKFISTFLSKVSFFHKHYQPTGEHSDLPKMQSDYAKLNYALYVLLNIWLRNSKFLYSNKKEKIGQIIKWCEEGEERRKSALQKARPKQMKIHKDLFSIVKAVKVQFNVK